MFVFELVKAYVCSVYIWIAWYQHNLIPSLIDSPPIMVDEHK